MINDALNVSNEIGKLRTVMLHRPGAELLNLTPASLDKLLFDDIPFLEEAQREHDGFASLLRAEGVEVLYLEDLCAEALDSTAEAREEYLACWLEESGLPAGALRREVGAYLRSFTDTHEFVARSLAGVRKRDIGLHGRSEMTLSQLVGHDRDYETDLLIDPMPNAYFTRDPFAVVGRGVMLNRMFSTTRRRETLLGEFIFRYHPRFRKAPRWYDRDSSYHIEGGDVLILSQDTLAVGISQRTQAAAIDELAQRCFWGAVDSGIETIYAFNIPVSRAFMHLDTVFTQIDHDKFTVHPAILTTLQVYRLTKGAVEGSVRIVEMVDTLEHVLAKALGIDVVRLVACGGGDSVAAAREQWNDGSNTLCIAPGRICVYHRNHATNEALARAGLELVVVPSAELSRGRGGPRCMSMPFVRDEA